jgi:DNA mismatch repair protein MutL
MGKIRVLPEILANKIAAGEIVERPASVVKELLENSLDAGASSIRVEVEGGGKKAIVLRDDGEGMVQDDAILAFDHHATSKLARAEDLGAIATLGFRGEALPSIASVSRLVLKTRHRVDSAEATGTEVQVHGGTIRTVKTIAWDRGTEVSVRGLFFNLPVRRKFLRSNETELGHITRLFTHYALAHPEIRFSLQSDGRNLIDLVPVGALRERIYQLFGDKFLENLVEIEGHSGVIRISGFSSKPHEQRSNSYSQFFYVNRRIVRDKVIASAVRQAYRNSMPSSAYPVALIFLELPTDQVDVNVHPSKIEIRFRQQSDVHDLIRDSIREALVRSPSIAAYHHRGQERTFPSGAETTAAHHSQSLPQSGTPLILTPGDGPDAAFQRAFQYPFRDVPAPGASPSTDHHSLGIRGDMLLGACPDGSQRPFQTSGVRIFGQFKNSYIIAGDDDGLLIIDQHVAHERILYEKLAEAIRTDRAESQGLLVPVSLELLPHQLPDLDRILPELTKSGFEVERFGGSALLVRAVPAVARDRECDVLLKEILEGIEREERTVDVDRLRDRIAVSTACHAAIKANTPLTSEKMQWLLDELSHTRIPTNCPHGRPIMLRFGLAEIERNFGRI